MQPLIARMLLIALFLLLDTDSCHTLTPHAGFRRCASQRRQIRFRWYFDAAAIAASCAAAASADAASRAAFASAAAAPAAADGCQPLRLPSPPLIFATPPV